MRFLSMVAAAAIACFATAAAANEVRVAYDADPVSLDPHEQLSGGTLQMSHMVFDPLVRWTQDLEFEPRLAESWERIDDTTVRFHLRQGVKFHSGAEMTAQDVLWTFERLKSSEDFKGIFAPVLELRVVDDYTIDLVTDGPFPLVLHTATYIFPMDSAFYTGMDERGRDKAEIIKHEDSYASTHASGTGPYIVTRREQGVVVEFERFGDYWDTESPGNVDRVVLTPIPEGPTRVAALLAGDVDFIAPVPPSDLARIEADPNVDLITMSGTRIITLQLNQERVEAFQDPRVRNAIVYAINNVGIVDRIMEGFGTPAAQMSPAGYLGYNEALTPRYDVARARELMAEAGYADGFTVTMMCPNNRYVNDFKICEASVAMLAQINITVELTTMPKAQYWPQFDERGADIMMIGWHSDTEDSANFYEFLAMTPDAETGRGQYNSGNYSNAEVDALTVASLTETDDAARAATLQNIEQILYDDAAFVPLHWQDLAWAARSGVHADRIVNVLNFPYFGDLVVDE